MDRHTNNPSPEDQSDMKEPGGFDSMLPDKMALLNDDHEMRVSEDGVGSGGADNSSEDTVATPKDLSADLIPDMQLKTVAVNTYRWDIANFNGLPDKQYSPTFTVGNHTFNILIFPRGNNGTGNCVSLFLNYIPPSKNADENSSTPINNNNNGNDNDSNGANGMKESKAPTYCCGNFLLAIMNPQDSKIYEHKVSYHRFTVEDNDWGFNNFLTSHSLSETTTTRNAPLMTRSGAISVVAIVKVVHDEIGTLWHNFSNWDSKRETGYVGLKNQGATCYMNSLLQSLYFTNKFRWATFRIPTSGDDEKSVPLALQRVFYHLQNSDYAVGTNELTRSFGWDTMDSFMQHDVQEFNRVLQDNIESKMKGTEVEGTVQKLFAGKMRSYIKCVNVNYESSREEDFYDIQLNVKGIQNLEESFKDYIKVEMLDGDNKYQAEGHGLQDAKKGIVFTKFPPVLHLHLKRFEYDFERDAMIKIYDRYEFPLTINLNEYLAEGTQESPQIYHLHGVLVHSGDVSAGHYCTFIRPKNENKWYKFDDDRVIPISEKEAVEDNYGGEYLKRNFARPNAPAVNAKKLTSAYMLVYIRDGDRGEILKPIANEDIPKHLIDRFEREKQMDIVRRKERENQHFFQAARIITDKHIAEKSVLDLGIPDDKIPGANNELPLVKVKKDEPMTELFRKLEEEFQVDKHSFRLWVIVKRQNNTIRVDGFPLQYGENDSILISDFRDKFFRLGQDFRFYLEVNVGRDGAIKRLSPLSEHSILLFFKYYDYERKTLVYLGSRIVESTLAVADLSRIFHDLIEFPPNTSFICYEEIKSTMVETLRSKVTLQASELGTGDIIVFQKAPPEDLQQDPSSCSTFLQYFDWYINRVAVTFKPCFNEENNKENMELEFRLELSRKETYDSIASKVAARLNCDPMKIRFHTQDTTTGSPKVGLRRVQSLTLKDMLQVAYHQQPHADIIFYEKLDFTINELESKKSIRILWLEKEFRESALHSVYISKHGTVTDVKDALLKAKAIELTGSGEIRLLEVSSHRVAHSFDIDESLVVVKDSVTLIGHEIPKDDLKKGESDFYVSVFHYFRDVYRPFGIPFRFLIKQDEIFSDTKKRICKLLGVGEKEFSKFKFSIVNSYSIVSELEDDNFILSSHKWSFNDHLGLDHVDKSVKADRFAGHERSIKIHN